MAYLTSRTAASSVACNDILHIVKTSDTSQGNPDGSSYKATVSQLFQCCVQDFYALNIHGCPTHLYVQPLDEGNVYFGENTAEDGFTIDLDVGAGGRTRLGLHENTPQYTLDFYSLDGRQRFFWYDNISGSAWDDVEFMSLSGESSLVSGYVVYSPGGPGSTLQGSGGINMGFVGFDHVPTNETEGFGTPGDSYIYALGCSENLNIINDSRNATCPNSTDHIRFYAHARADNASGPHLHIHGRPSGGSLQGEVCVNCTNPSERLDVNGNGRFRFFNPSSPANLQVGSDGTLQLASSDFRLKENISTIENSLEKVLALRGVNFSWKSDSNSSINLGFIAQEVEQIEPRLVFTNENSEDKIKGVHYEMFAPLLVEAVKELNEKTKLKEYTPTSVNDPYGEKGDQVFDDNFMYIKTGAGWKKFPLMDI